MKGNGFLSLFALSNSSWASVLSQVVNRQMTHLGRAKGNKVMVVCQKYLTGHPKGPGERSGS